MALAAVLVVFSVVFGVRSDKDIEQLLDEPNVIEKFNKSAGDKTRAASQVSPLVQQANAFALYLNPPEPKAPRTITRNRRPSVIPGPSATPKFTVVGTCYYKNRPEMSLALIDQPGKGLNWVRQSSTVGHLFIQEIKDGVVVVKDSSGTFELRAEQKPHVSLLAGSSSANEAKTNITSGPSQTTGSKTPIKTSEPYSARTSSRAGKLPRPAVPQKTEQEDSVMEEVAAKLAQLQRTFRSDKTGSVYSAQEKAAMMNRVIEEIKVMRSGDLSKEEQERLSILSKELMKKMEEH
jgi:hypothetical protein